MARTNDDVAALLREYAELLSITGGDQFRARNYEKAAKAVGGYPGDLGAVPDAALTRIDGVGAAIAGKIIEFRRTGTIAAVDELRAKIPPGVQAIATVPGIGPKRALQLSRELGVASIADLDAAVRAGRLRRVSGFGAKSEERILRSIGVITRDQPLRDALTALPSDPSVAQIEAVLAANIPGLSAGLSGEITARSAERKQPARSNQPADGHHALVQTKDLRGDLHTHTNLTDGIASLAEMVAAARERGYAYYAITDHAPNLVMQQMTDEKMLAQRAEVAALADRAGLDLLHGTELNIGPDGSVDWEAGFLSGFDICVASVHSSFDQDRKTMTERFITAAENPYVNIIGHPLTRKLGRRPPVDVDLDALYEACARTGTALEINASPARMDLPPEHIAAAKSVGVKFSIDSDAHSLGDLKNIPYGVASARLGGLTDDDVINAWPLERLTEFLRRPRALEYVTSE
jgi:histidinol phosphatase-like PHP family hydrolase/predicted flap endonuclease-1-like 5' DNA nuclease